MQNNDTVTTGLMRKPNSKKRDLMQEFSLAVDTTVKKKSLEEILADLPQAERVRLQKYGRNIMLLSSPFSGSYYSQVRRVYPNLERAQQLLLAELLQKMKPREDTTNQYDEAAAARQLQSQYLDKMLAKTAPPDEPKKSKLDLPGTPVGIEALVVSFLKNVNGANEASKPKKNGGRFNAYSEPVANADGQFSRKEDFVSLLQPIATKVAANLGIDPKIIMAQAILETGYGSAVKGKNYFGIKSHGRSGGIDVVTHESLGGKPVKMTDKFRSYESLEDSMKDYGTFLKENKRYQPLLHADTLEDQLEAIGAIGYATDPRYKQKLKGIIEGKTFNELLG